MKCPLCGVVPSPETRVFGLSPRGEPEIIQDHQCGPKPKVLSERDLSFKMIDGVGKQERQAPSSLTIHLQGPAFEAWVRMLLKSLYRDIEDLYRDEGEEWRE